MKARNSIVIPLILFCIVDALAQMDTYACKQRLLGVTEQWHGITLPDTVFAHVGQHLHDIRIYGILEKDTLEAPYFLRVNKNERTKKTIDFTRLNTSSNSQGHYFTFEIPALKSINMIRLDFTNDNFDWPVDLEGSHNQEEWFTIVTDYRILALKNEQTDYKFTDLNFPKSNYKYYRIRIKTDQLPELQSANISLLEDQGAEYREYPVQKLDIDEEGKKTMVHIDLGQRLPLSYLHIDIQENIDYYRSVTVEYAKDSIRTEKGIKYSYGTLASGTLSSIEKKPLSFRSTLAQKLRISIQNHDNRPLNIKGVYPKGYVHEIVARFDRPADYYLVYGRKNGRAPIYDIAKTKKLTALAVKHLRLGEVQKIPKATPPSTPPLFENKLWLWAVMGIIILILGVFTLNMIRAK